MWFSFLFDENNYAQDSVCKQTWSTYQINRIVKIAVTNTVSRVGLGVQVQLKRDLL